MVRERGSCAWNCAVCRLALLAGLSLTGQTAAAQDGPMKFIGSDENGQLSVSVAPPEMPAIKSNKGAPPLDLGWDSKPDPDCGANVLYLYLGLHGVAISREKAHQEVPTTGEGASLLDLKQACERHGVEARVLEIAPAALRRVALPVIARMSAKDAASAHYVLVTAVDEEQLNVIDGTSGEHLLVASWAFAQEFTGHVLGQPSPSTKWLWLGVGVVALESAFLGLLFLGRR